MTILQIEHPVPNYNGWKKAFDSDPVNRKKSGVKRYSIRKALDIPGNVMVELEFEDIATAEAMLESLKKLWQVVEGKVMTNPKTRLLEQVEIIEL